MPTATSAGKSSSGSKSSDAKAKAAPATKESPKAAKPAAAVKVAAEKKPAAKPAAVEVKAPEVRATGKPAAAAPPPQFKSTANDGKPPKMPPRIEYEAFLAKLTPKDRLNIERHLVAVEEVSTKAHAKLWKRLATAMMTMAPHSAKANGQQSMQFYIQDGKYRMQIFAIEDLRDGTVHVYMTDAMDEAVAAGAMPKYNPADEPDMLRLPGTTDLLNAERMDGKVSNPAPFYKDMLGWNRRAVHVALPAMASEPQIAAVETLMAYGAKKAGAI